MTIKAKKSKINLREKLAELLNFRQIRDRLDGLGLYLGKDRTGTAENLAVRGGANVDDLQLAEISAALGGTAVDVFVYDTRNDSDGGKWRERTSHTSWYNEELNTATRGGRREFPAVAVIIAEINKVTIYDGDDPDLPMWMVFPSTSSLLTSGSTTSNLSLYALNGDLVFGNSSTYYGVLRINFITERIIGYHDSTSFFGLYKYNISQRSLSNGTSDFVGDSSTFAIVNRRANDVAMTVLPNAPIDDDTGLPVPTIAVATDGGVSVIRDDGSVVDSASSSTWHRVSFYNSVLYGTLDGNPSPVYIIDDYSSNGFIQSARIYPNSAFYASDSGVALLANAVTDESEIQVLNDIAIGNVAGLTLVDDKEVKTTLHSYTTATYNTGWMPGDIKLATLSDTKVEKVGVDESELVSNGTFDSNTNDWSSTNSSTLSVDNQRLKIQGVGSSYPNAYISVNIVEGVEYEVSAEYISNSNSFSGRIRVSSSSPLGADIVNGDIKSPGTNHIYRFTAPSTGSVYVALMLQDVSGNSSGIWDNISVKQTGELITNGTFNNGTEGWTLGTGWSVSGGVASVNNTSGANSFLETFPVVEVGKYYVFTFDVTDITAGTISLTYQDGGGYAGMQSVENVISSRNSGTGSGPMIRYFKASTSGSAKLVINALDTTVASVDNASFREIELDRSVNNRGLKIFGEIDKTPVAPGADLVAYSGFSVDNYLMQPYNSDLDFGTGDFCVMGWFKQSPTTNFHTYFSREGRISVYIDASTSKLNFRITDGTNHMNCLSANAVDSDTWTFFVGVKSNDTTYNYINGKLEQTANYTTVGSIDGDYDSYFGVNHVSSDRRPAEEIALWRISATAPTAEQIAKIYRDEKALFTDGAQATFYGTDDAVTALAYDDKTELLHVGTSSGRSDFAGLRRINNTTTAVTTSISASNNLIAEQ